MTGKAKKPQGFATFSKEKQEQVSSAGGKEAWRLGKAHKWTSEEASAAGKKGGRPPKKVKTIQYTMGIPTGLSGPYDTNLWDKVDIDKE